MKKSIDWTEKNSDDRLLCLNSGKKHAACSVKLLTALIKTAVLQASEFFTASTSKVVYHLLDWLVLYP